MFAHVKLDESMAPSAFVEMDIEKLIRMRENVQMNNHSSNYSVNLQKCGTFHRALSP